MFVLSSLRPAFASIYPATRPDLAAEIFFHTKPGSPLLKGITEDDLITWFGKTDAGVPKVGQDIPTICECGKICKETIHQLTTDTPTTTFQTEMPQRGDQKSVDDLQQPTIVDNFEQSQINLTNFDVTRVAEINVNLVAVDNVSKDSPIIVPSIEVTNDNDIVPTVINATINKPAGDEIVVQQEQVPVRKSNPAKMLFDVAKKQPYQKKQPMLRKKGTLKHTYGENHEMLKQSIKAVHNPEVSVSILPFETNTAVAQTTTEIMGTESSTVMTVTLEEANLKLSTLVDDFTPTTDAPTITAMSELKLTTMGLNNTSNFDTVAPQTHVSNVASIFKNTYLKKKDFLKKKTPDKSDHLSNSVSEIDQSLPVPTKLSTLQIPKSINREKQHLPLIPISETTLGLVSEMPPENFLPNKNDQLFVIDKNALWGLLKEVVRIEMDKNQEKMEAESSAAANRETESKLG